MTSCIPLYVLVLVCFLTSYGFNFLEQLSLEAWKSEFQNLSTADADEIIRQLREHLTDLPQPSVYADNLAGLIYSSEGRYSDSLVMFALACDRSKYSEQTIFDNWIFAWRAMNKDNLILELRNLMSKYSESIPLLQALVNELRQDKSEESYQSLLTTVKQFPSNYKFWLVFADLHLIRNFIDGGSDPETAGSFATEVGLVQYALTMFPRSPELNLLRTIHLIYGNDLSCAAYFMHMAHTHRSLDLKVLRPAHYNSVASLLAEAEQHPHDEEHARQHCVPYMAKHSVESYQALYDLIESVAGQGWGSLWNITTPAPGLDRTVNTLVPASVSVIVNSTGHAQQCLPSLQVGCNRAETCALPGFLVADAMLAPSTHFLTQAYDLSMVSDASVGLVYSSHTLEHMSHTLSPTFCISGKENGARVCESEIGATLTEWRRVLAPGGRLLVSVPDLAILAAAVSHPLSTAQNKYLIMGFIFGGQTDQYDFHKTGFYPELLEELLTSHGFCNIVRVDGFWLYKDATYNNRDLSLSVHAVAC